MSDAAPPPEQPEQPEPLSTGAGEPSGSTDPSRSTVPFDRGKIIESFAPTSGRVLGIIVLVIGLVAIGDIIVEWRTMDGLTAALIVVALGALVWMSMVRPAVALYDRTLVLRNFARDAQIPWHLIDKVDVTPVLTVEVGDKKYRSVAIAASGADRRAELKAQRRAGAGAFGLSSPVPSPNSTGPIRQSAHAVSRIRTVAEQNAEKSTAIGSVVWRWAVIELAVLGIAVLGVVVTSLF